MMLTVSYHTYQQLSGHHTFKREVCLNGQTFLFLWKSYNDIQIYQKEKKGTKEMEQKSQKQSSRKVIILISALIIAAAAMFGIYKIFIPKGQAGAKAITVTVVHADESSKDFRYQTDEAYLGDVLKAEKLVEGTEGEFGMFITSVDGEEADDSKEQWWCITKDGDQLNTSADQTPIEDGDQFELTLTEGY